MTTKSKRGAKKTASKKSVRKVRKTPARNMARPRDPREWPGGPVI